MIQRIAIIVVICEIDNNDRIPRAECSAARLSLMLCHWPIEGIDARLPVPGISPLGRGERRR